MTTSIQTKTIRAGFEPIPGYTLEEMVGRGGFGEVWRADAPGGLKKAVKFVFGAQDQSRACRELKSLERIKGVHHPFLLTLERFEIVNDQLVIVTELADGSLEDVVKRHRDNGSCGIPRDVLVSHLHDAADALDYLHEHYQLQHLDIKPGNLLMVGGHVKVADFGLLKDLTEAECSLVGGLTPIYAPPEVFDGRPSMHSDQYSLAVMYQELLTGTRPFTGRTIAQLATQHVHSAPNLDPLPPSDRPVVARALEKNPTRRFPNCKAFVESLYDSRHRSVASHVVSSEADTETAGEAEQKVADLPQIDDASPKCQATSQHVMVVALGGTGAACLRDLRGRVADLLTACPVQLHGVLIDTDVSTIHSMRVAEASALVPPCQTIHIPLRSANEYRQNGTERLQTVSRRWIYNVPRSRATEGMRPLGRLALVDHGPQVVKGLQLAIERLVESAGEQTPTVYVLGSLAGGTASGVYLDVVHLLRHLMDEAGLEEARILSLLAAAELRADPATPLALHDTHAALIEMQHYMFAGNGYPGDAGAGFHSVPAARTPLHDVYLIASPPKSSLSPPARRIVADYLWTDATGGGELLAAARAPSGEEDGTAATLPTVRSVGVVPLGISRSLEQRLLVPATVRHLIIRWLGLPSKARAAAPALAERLTRRCAICREAFADATWEEIRHDEGLSEQRVADAIATSDEPALWKDPESEAFRAAVNHLTRQIDEHPRAEDPDLMVESIITNLKRELTVSLHDQRIDITTAIEAIKLVVQSLSGVHGGEDEGNASVQTTHPGDEVAELESKDTADPTDPVDPATPESVLLEAAAENLVGERIERLCGRLMTLQSRFEQFATVLARAIVQVTKDQPTESNPWEEMPEPIRVHFEPIMQKLHQLVISRWLLLPLNDSNDCRLDVTEMVDDVWEEAMPLVSEIVDNKDCDYNNEAPSSELTANTVSATLRLAGNQSRESTLVTQPLAASPFDNTDPEEKLLPVDDAIDAVKPTLLSCGGSQRLVLVVGNEAERRRFEPEVRQAHPSGLTVALIPEAAPRLIHEAQQIEMERVLDHMTKLNGNSQVTGRLLTRTDVSWAK